MITRGEYLDALKIVETYRLEQHLDTTEFGSITCREFYYKHMTKMSGKLKRAFYYLMEYYTYIAEVDNKAFLRVRGAGQKTLDEYNNIMLEYLVESN